MRQQEEDDGMASVEEKKTILLVEKDEDQVTFAMRALRRHGIVDEVAVAGDGTEAIDYLFGESGYAGRDTSSSESPAFISGPACCCAPVIVSVPIPGSAPAPVAGSEGPHSRRDLALPLWQSSARRLGA